MNIKKLAVLALAVCIGVMSLAGCGAKAPQIAASYNGGDIPAGVYITHQINAVNDAFTKLNNPYLTPAELLKSEHNHIS